MQEIERGIEYIAAHEDIRDVLISGGDPLLLPNKRLDEILDKLMAIDHLDLVRIGTRVPCVWPQRIIEDAELVEVLRKHTPQSLKDPQFFINTHFNHPNEITEQSYQAIRILRTLGIPIGNQTVLLKGVNDDTDVMRDLMHGLGRMGVKPYYLYYADLVEGTGHFRTELYKGKEICRDLCGATTGFLRPDIRGRWAGRARQGTRRPRVFRRNQRGQEGRDHHLGDRAREGLRQRSDREGRGKAQQAQPEQEVAARRGSAGSGGPAAGRPSLQAVRAWSPRRCRPG